MPTNIRLSVVSVACALFLSGLAIGVGTAYSLYNKKLQEANLTSASLLAFTQNQSTMLVQTGSGKLEKAVSAVSALPATTQAAAVAPGLPVSTAPAPALPASSPLPASSSSLFPAAPIPVPVPISPASATQSAEVSRSTLESPAPAKSALVASASSAPASKPALAKAKKHAKPVAAPRSVLVQAPASARAPRASAAATAAAVAQPQVPVLPPVTMDQAGIAGIDTAGIRFRSGRQVNIGSEFPTGEKLLSVSPSEGRIVTDRRVINLIKPQAAN